MTLISFLQPSFISVTALLVAAGPYPFFSHVVLTNRRPTNCVKVLLMAVLQRPKLLKPIRLIIKLKGSNGDALKKDSYQE